MKNVSYIISLGALVYSGHALHMFPRRPQPRSSDHVMSLLSGRVPPTAEQKKINTANMEREIAEQQAAQKAAQKAAEIRSRYYRSVGVPSGPPDNVIPRNSNAISTLVDGSQNAAKNTGDKIPLKLRFRRHSAPW